jgi:carbamoyltransferase
MVERDVAPRYWRLIKEFEKLTGVPILLNTSFNENEPIVMSPQHALETFAKTRMDVLVLGNHVVRRSGARAPGKAAREPVSVAELGLRP